MCGEQKSQCRNDTFHCDCHGAVLPQSIPDNEDLAGNTELKTALPMRSDRSTCIKDPPRLTWSLSSQGIAHTRDAKDGWHRTYDVGP